MSQTEKPEGQGMVEVAWRRFLDDQLADQLCVPEVWGRLAMGRRAVVMSGGQCRRLQVRMSVLLVCGAVVWKQEVELEESGWGFKTSGFPRDCCDKSLRTKHPGMFPSELQERVFPHSAGVRDQSYVQSDHGIGGSIPSGVSGKVSYFPCINWFSQSLNSDPSSFESSHVVVLVWSWLPCHIWAGVLVAPYGLLWHTGLTSMTQGTAHSRILSGQGCFGSC